MRGLQKKYLWLEDWVVQDLLKHIGKPNHTKHYELLTGMMLNKFCELQWSKKCWIGIELSNKYEREIPEYGQAYIEDLREMVEKKAEENTLTDIIIATKTNTQLGEIPKGMAFQLKRFGKDPTKQDTNALINFLNIDCRNFAHAANTALVVLMETPKEIDLRKLSTSINTQNYPFEKIILISLHGIMLTFTGIWPESGQLEYNISTRRFITI